MSEHDEPSAEPSASSGGGGILEARHKSAIFAIAAVVTLVLIIVLVSSGGSDDNAVESAPPTTEDTVATTEPTTTTTTMPSLADVVASWSVAATNSQGYSATAVLEVGAPNGDPESFGLVYVQPVLRIGTEAFGAGSALPTIEGPGLVYINARPFPQHVLSLDGG